MKNTARFVLFALLLATALMHLGCATSTTPEQDLEKRVHAYMTAKVEGDWQLVYTFYDENFKSQVPKSYFSTTRDAQFPDYSIESIQMDPSGKKAVVQVKHSMTVGGLALEDITDTQNWVLENKDWFLAAKPVAGILAD